MLGKKEERDRRKKEKEEKNMCKGHFGRRVTELIQNTVFKGQGFERPVGFAYKKKQLMREKICPLGELLWLP